MRKIILLTAFALAATPVMAQQVAAPQVSASERATQLMLNRETTAHQGDLAVAVQLNDQVTALTKQVQDLTAENTKLKAPVEAPKADTATTPTAAPVTP